MQNVEQSRGRDATSELQGASQRRVRAAQKSDADFVPKGPLRMAADGLDKRGRDMRPMQCVHDRDLGKARVFERRLPDLRFLIEQQGSGDEC